jgi:serine/threonine protein kinase
MGRFHGVSHQALPALYSQQADYAAVGECSRACPHLYLQVMDWCSGGSVVDLMQRSPGGCLDERAAAAVMKSVLEVLAHCHSRWGGPALHVYLIE